ncbi:MAG: extracellular solute-binding protein [Alcaligenaceae bacterium]|nr:extracellular solute-binding protein [Alcaligenaceae bacterium]
MASNVKFSRRRLIAGAASASALTIASPFIRTAHAAGSLSIGFWDHWVPGANDSLTKLCKEWGEKEKVDIKIDYITSQGSKLQLTAVAEAQAKSGHDILQLISWDAPNQAKNLVPVDDIVNAAIKKNGKATDVVEYLGKVNGSWIGVPATNGSQVKGPCGRMDLLAKYANLDVVKMYPGVNGKPDKALQDQWTWDTFLSVAEKCHKGGNPFGLGLGQTTDSVDWVGALFAAYGAMLVDAKGNITVNSDATKQVLEYMQRLVKVIPPDVFAWDDASNNKYLISGQGSLIMNPPSAWAVAVRDNLKVAEQCWTFPSPKGPKGRFSPGLPFFWGTWKWSKNIPAAKSLLAHLSDRDSIEKMVIGSGGYDIPGYSNLRDFKTWAEVGPPVGVSYNYPPRGEEIVSIAAAPAPVAIAQQIYAQATMTKMIAKCTQGGDSVAKAIGWASSELEGFMRT